MRAEAARADRFHAVRAAAAGWRDSGTIDDATLDAISSAYPEDRVRLGLGFRILAGLAAFLGGGAFVLLVGSMFRIASGTVLVPLALAIAFTMATELQLGRLRRAQAGAEYATAILAALCAGFAWAVVPRDSSLAFYATGFAVAFAAAAWRWGYASMAAVAAALLLVACADGSLGRARWLLFGPLALPMMLSLARSPSLPPSSRRSVEAIGLVLLGGAYVAINIYSLDHRWIESFGGGSVAAPGLWARRAAIAGTILMPPCVFSLGAWFRERALLAAGALFTTASLVTLRRYHPIGPWWLALIVGGVLCLVLAIVLRRWLDAGPGRERRGFTAEPLFPDRRLVESARIIATVAALSPGPRVAPGAGFEGGGGRSGGGGATGGA